MEEESDKNMAPSCPYCDATDLDCDHILLHFDLTFEEAVSGYLYETDIVLETIKEIIYNDLVNHKQPKFHSENIKAMYNWAAENFHTGDELEDLQMDLTAYYHFLGNETWKYETETVTYTDEGAPGMSSVYNVIFCNNPELATNSFVGELYAGKL